MQAHPALVYALVENREVTHQHFLHLRGVNRYLAVTLHTLFGIGSVTKLLTAVAIVQLRQCGLLDLDDPVEVHIPCAFTSNGESFRLRYLLSHSSGVPTRGPVEERRTAQRFRLGFPVAHDRDVIT